MVIKEVIISSNFMNIQHRPVPSVFHYREYGEAAERVVGYGPPPFILMKKWSFIMKSKQIQSIRRISSFIYELTFSTVVWHFTYFTAHTTKICIWRMLKGHSHLEINMECVSYKHMICSTSGVNLNVMPSGLIIWMSFIVKQYSLRSDQKLLLFQNFLLSLFLSAEYSTLKPTHFKPLLYLLMSRYSHYITGVEK